MSSTKRFTLGLAALLAGSLSSIAQLVVYDSFGPNSTYNQQTVWAVSGASVSGGYRGQAQYFAPAVSCDLSQVELATYHVSGSSPLSNFFIARDSGLDTPGDILESFYNVSTPTGLLTLTSQLKPLLTAGTLYWLCMEPSTATSYNGWYQNNQNVTDGFAFERSPWSWSFVPGRPSAPNTGAFEILATPVPEPSGLWIGLVATGYSCVCRRNRRCLPRALHLPKDTCMPSRIGLTTGWRTSERLPS